MAQLAAHHATCRISAPTVLFGEIPPAFPQASPVAYGSLLRNQAGNASTGARKQPDFSWPRPFIVRRINLWVGTAPASQALIVDVNHWDGSAFQSMFATRPQINAAGTTGGRDPDGTYRYRCFRGQDGGTQADLLGTWDVDQVGSGTVGADLNVAIQFMYFTRPLEVFLSSTSGN